MTKVCAICGEVLPADSRRHKVVCGDSHRVAWNRWRNKYNATLQHNIDCIWELTEELDTPAKRQHIAQHFRRLADELEEAIKTLER